MSRRIEYEDSAKAYFQDRLLAPAVAALMSPLIVLGDRLGLYRLLAAEEAMSLEELASASATHPRFLSEWLAAGCAAGHLTYIPETGRYRLEDHPALGLALDDSPIFIPGAHQIVVALSRSIDRLEQAFRTGNAVGWHEQDPLLFEGLDRFIRPGYGNNLVPKWIPALGPRMMQCLTAGGRIADIGCGRGAAALQMAAAFPAARVTGFDNHPESIADANAAAEAAGIGNATFIMAEAAEVHGGPFDLVTCLDCFHDMGDPVAVARAVRDALSDNGSWLLVEPAAGDRLDQNVGIAAQMFYAVSTAVCVQAAAATHPDGPVLGAQAGLSRLAPIFAEAGFSHVETIARTPFKMILEVRP